MLRRFLAERFKLRMHHETRQLPIYELVMAKTLPRGAAGVGRNSARPLGNCGRDCGSIRTDGAG